MYKATLERYVKNKFSQAGIELNGPRPWDIQVHDDRFFSKVIAHGSLGFGESYMDGFIDSQHLDESMKHLASSNISQENLTLKTLIHYTGALLLNKQSKRRALIVGKQHYDLSNHLFQCMLDKRMTYSCGYWKNASNLDEAQEAKLDLVCRKIGLKPGMRVLDIGTGWGSFAKFAAERYGAHVTGITISERQLELAKQLCHGLPVDLKFQDYRDITGSYDRVVSIGQMEHVGYKNYRLYMQIVHRVLKPDGLFLLHTIGSNLTHYSGDPWIEKYIFPNGMLPSLAQLTNACEHLFVVEDLHNFGADYDKTLLAWWHNFDNHWKELQHHYDPRFYRMWKYYLLLCAGGFRARRLQLWQIVLSKSGIPGGYTSIR